MEWFTSNINEIAQIVTSLLGVFSLISVMTPNESDNQIAAFLLRACNVLGLASERNNT